MGVDGADGAAALQLMRAEQNAYYIQSVQEALQSEKQREFRLRKVSTKQEAKRLEKQFARERIADKERLHRIQEDHALLLNVKIAEWKAKGQVQFTADVIAAKTRAGRQQPKQTQRKAKFSRETLDRLAGPRIPTASEEADDRLAASSSRGGVETSQELQFYKDVFRKQDRARLARGSSQSTLSAENLQTMSEMELLRKKANLLSELHGVVSMEARIIQDDQCTVRSSVSSWKSAAYQPPR